MKEELAAAYDHCRSLTRREARNFYYGFLLLPAPQRRAIYAVYAFARQCDDIVDGDLPPGEAKRQLALQREQLDRCLQGNADGPVFVALGDAVQRYGIPGQYLRELIEGVEMDFLNPRYRTFDHLRVYCHKVASVVGLISIEVFGYRGGEAARRQAAALGTALQLTNILRDLREDAARGRVYIPQDEMELFGYPEASLLAGEVNDNFRRLMSFQCARARSYFEEGRKLLPLLPRRARACVAVMGGIYERILDGIERDPGVVFRERVGLSTGQKLALAGRELARSLAR